MKPSLIMEDHSHAYGFWKELGVAQAVCVHVDAHLDVMDRGFHDELLAKLNAGQSRSELESLSPPAYLPWGGLHCGNYLYPALKEGLIEYLVWVVPEGMIGSTPLLDFARDELLNWVEMSLQEFQALRVVEKRVVGTLCGVRFTLCTSKTLPPLDTSRPLLLDIDIDYFQDENDKVWQSPSQLKAELNLPDFQVLTVAVSVDGGYTALENRYLAEVTEHVFLENSEDLWEQRVEELLTADRAREGNQEAYDRFDLTGTPEWWSATLTLKRAIARGKPVEEASLSAVTHDPRFRASSFNEALVQARHQRLDEALLRLGEESEHVFMRAILALKGGDPERSRTQWRQFLQQTELGPAEKAHSLFMLGQANLQLQRTEEAFECLSQAVELDAGNFQYLLYLGLAHQLGGDLKKAAKAWRKALGDHPEAVACVELHLELARLYREMGRAALAEAELQRLRQKDTTGEFKLVIGMEQIRAASRPAEKNRSLWRTGINLVGVH